MRNLLLMILALALFTACQEKKAPQGNAEMDTFITDLMEQMTLEEKLGQLNLITPAGRPRASRPDTFEACWHSHS